MTIVSIKSGSGAEFRRVEFSDGSILSFRICYVPPALADGDLCTPGQAGGRELSAEEEAGLRFAAACQRAEKAALRMIARAEQSVWGLTRKLEKRGHGAACAAAVVSRLVDVELVNDRRFAQLWLETRRLRARSPRRLLAGLRARGISRDDAETALRTIFADETEWAMLLRFTAALRRSRTFGRLERTVSARVVLSSIKAALKNEGFSIAAIQRYMDDSESTG
jgi:regulatory protein